MLNFYNNIGTDFVTGAGLVNRYYSTKRLTNVQRDSFSVTPNLHEVIIGCSLGDLYIHKQVNFALLQFEQSLINEAYILHLYALFKDYCSSAPKYRSRKPDFRTGNIHSSIYFRTYSLPCFNYYRDLFYVDKVKRIPENIGELLTAISLAFWIQEDGYFNKRDNTITICTDSYLESEVDLLINVLNNKDPKMQNNFVLLYVKVLWTILEN
jgi:hypothetical protein